MHLLSHTPARPHRPSAVSRALKAIQLQMDAGPARPTGEQNHLDLIEHAEQPAAFRIRVANCLSYRRRAYKLGYEVYLKSGYAAPNPTGLLVAPFDTQPQTFTLLAEDVQGRPAGTLSLVFDGPPGLPCDELFPSHTADLRGQGRRLVEVTRFAIADDFQHSRVVLLRMINLIFLYAARLHHGTDFLIEIHPRHAGFYRRYLGFQQIGEAVPCPRVLGAPAVLLRVDFKTYYQAREDLRNPTRQPTRSPLLYQRFYHPDRDEELLHFLRSQHRPPSPIELRFIRAALGSQHPARSNWR